MAVENFFGNHPACQIQDSGRSTVMVVRGGARISPRAMSPYKLTDGGDDPLSLEQCGVCATKCNAMGPEA